MAFGEYYNRLPSEHKANICSIQKLNEGKAESEFLDRLYKYIESVTGHKTTDEKNPYKILLDYCNSGE